jgi:uncharacterized membrane protein (UPF0136 family)
MDTLRAKSLGLGWTHMLDLFRDPFRDAMTSYLFFFGAFSFVGGVIGYLKAKSRASLIAGTISGALLALAGWLAGHYGGGAGRAGVFLGLFVSAALAVRFGKAFRSTKKVFPAGIMTLLGVAGVVLTVMGLARWQ